LRLSDLNIKQKAALILAIQISYQQTVLIRLSHPLGTTPHFLSDFAAEPAWRPSPAVGSWGTTPLPAQKRAYVSGGCDNRISTQQTTAINTKNVQLLRPKGVPLFFSPVPRCGNEHHAGSCCAPPSLPLFGCRTSRARVPRFSPSRISLNLSAEISICRVVKPASHNAQLRIGRLINQPVSFVDTP